MAIKADFKPYYSDFVFVGHSVSTIKGNIAYFFASLYCRRFNFRLFNFFDNSANSFSAFLVAFSLRALSLVLF